MASYQPLQHIDQSCTKIGIQPHDFSQHPSGRKPGIENRPLLNNITRKPVPVNPASSVPQHNKAESTSESPKTESWSSSTEIHHKDARISSLKQPGWWARLVADSWTLELISGFVSFAAIASVVGVLWGYDQKRMPALMHGITLNAVISFLATISRTSIMLCIGTVLSQGKWLWFKTQRSLLDLQDLEDASRGPLGSMYMLFSRKGGVVPCIAALLTVATLGFDPFVQQLLTIQNRMLHVPADGITINSTTTITRDIFAALDTAFTTGQITAAMLIDIPLKTGATSGGEPAVLGQPIRKRSGSLAQVRVSHLRADCPGGNCVWQPYHGLDICTQCRSTTHEVSIRNLSPKSLDIPAMVSRLSEGNAIGDTLSSSSNWQIEPKHGRKWPFESNLTVTMRENNTRFATWPEVTQKVVWPLNFDSALYVGINATGWTPENFAGIEQPVAAIGFAEFQVGSNGLPFLRGSLECALTYCVNQFNRSVIQGNLVTDILSTHYGNITGDPNNQSWSAEVNGKHFKVPAEQYRYGVDIAPIVSYLLGSSNYTYGGDCALSQAANCTLYPGSDSGTLTATNTEAWRGVDLTDDFTMVLGNVRSAVSDVVQQFGNTTQQGDNFIETQFVVVRWTWIALPATVVFLGLIVLGLTVWQTSRLQVPSWKSSLLPLLYRYEPVNGGIPESTKSASTRSMTTKEDASTASNLVSIFEVQAGATVTRLARTATDDQVWQIQSVEIVQETTKH